MLFVIVLDSLVVAAILWVGLRKGVASALPVAAFFLTLFPEESKFSAFGLFDITTQRMVIIVLLALATFSHSALKKTRPKLPLRNTILLFVIWWAISTVNSVEFTVSLKALISQVLDYVIVYYIFAKNARDPETVRNILFSLVAGVTVCSVLALPEAYSDWTVISLFPAADHYFVKSGNLYVDLARGLRTQSTFGHPILFGSALAMTIPMAFYLLGRKAALLRTKLFLWASILIQFWSIYKTGSRGPWLALGLALTVFFIFGDGGARRRLALVAFVGFVAIAARPGVWMTILADYTSTLDSNSYEGGSYQYRYALYHLAVQELGRSVPRAMWGYGPESFYFLNLSAEIDGTDMSFSSCDSSFAALLIETGYVGFLIVIVLLSSAVVRTIWAYRKLPRPANQICLCFLVAILTFIFMMTNVAIFRWGQQAAMFWIVMGLALTYPHLLRQAATKRIRRNLRSASMAAQSA